MLTNVFRRFPGIFIEKTTFEEFKEIYMKNKKFNIMMMKK